MLFRQALQFLIENAQQLVPAWIANRRFAVLLRRPLFLSRTGCFRQTNLSSQADRDAIKPIGQAITAANSVGLLGQHQKCRLNHVVGKVSVVEQAVA